MMETRVNKMSVSTQCRIPGLKLCTVMHYASVGQTESSGTEDEPFRHYRALCENMVQLYIRRALFKTKQPSLILT
jgi:hypothetical protein